MPQIYLFNNFSVDTAAILKLTHQIINALQGNFTLHQPYFSGRIIQYKL